MALVAAALLRQHVTLLKVRVVIVVDPMRLEPAAEFDALVTVDRPVLCAQHSSLIHRVHPRFHRWGLLHE